MALFGRRTALASPGDAASVCRSFSEPSRWFSPGTGAAVFSLTAGNTGGRGKNQDGSCGCCLWPEEFDTWVGRLLPSPAKPGEGLGVRVLGRRRTLTPGPSPAKPGEGGQTSA